MADPNGNGGSVRITGAMLLYALAALVMLWAGWVTTQSLAVATVSRRLDGIVSTLSCTQRDGNKTPAEGK